MTSSGDRLVLLDRCPHCCRVDYLPLLDLAARCHQCGTVFRRRWVQEGAEVRRQPDIAGVPAGTAGEAARR